MHSKTIAIVVTYNRCDLLLENIQALKGRLYTSTQEKTLEGQAVVGWGSI